MNYPDAIKWLFGTQQFGIKLGLDGLRRLLKEFLAFPGEHKLRQLLFLLELPAALGRRIICRGNIIFLWIDIGEKKLKKS